MGCCWLLYFIDACLPANERYSFESTPSPESAENSRLLIVIASIVCVFSAVFIIAGDYAGNAVGKIAKVDYAEVVPSIEGTIELPKESTKTVPCLVLVQTDLLMRGVYIKTQR